MNQAKIQFWYKTVTYLLLSLTEGLNTSMVAPFFPIRAELLHKTSKTFIGFCMASSELGGLLTNISLLYFCKNIRKTKIPLVTSGCLAAITFGGFGVCDRIENKVLYQVSQVGFRFLCGSSASLIWGLGVKFLINDDFSEQLTAKLMTGVFTTYFLGISSGPFIGGLIYQFFGYDAIFVLLCIVEIIVSLSLCFTESESRKLDGSHLKPATSNKCIFKLMFSFSFMQLCASQLTIFSIVAFNEVTFALLLSSRFHMLQKNIVYVFSFGTALSLVGSSLALYINGRCWFRKSITCVILLQFFATTFIFFSQYESTYSLALAVFGFLIIIFAHSLLCGAFALSYRVLINAILGKGYDDVAKISSSVMRSTFTVAARFLGNFLLAGVLNDILGYYIVIAGFPIVLSFLLAVEFITIFFTKEYF